MHSRFTRFLLLALGIATIFVAVAAILVHVIPGPHRGTDYLVIGTVATFVSLAVLFVVLIKTSIKAPDLFYKKRDKLD